jgi:DNA polymerase eta
LLTDQKDLQTVHVATFNMHDPVARYNPNPSQLTYKVSLDVYRKASLNIFKIFQSHCDKVQKAGLDEAFLDVTDIVNARLVERYAAEISEDANEEFPDEILWNPLGFLALSDEESELLNPTTETAEGEEAISHLIASDKSPPAPKLKGTWKDLQLSIGAEIAKEIREDIFKTLQYTCSAGIAHNKTVAKLCSALNKPNKQVGLADTFFWLKLLADMEFDRQQCERVSY